jgi:biopolymer transport protein ExbD
MKTYIDSEEPEVRIEILPLIDVIFCILTFFILAALGLTRPEGIDLDLPQAETGKAQLGATLPVRLDVLGQLYVDKQPVSQEQLTQTLVSYIKAQPQGVVVLNADKLVSYDQVIQVLDLLQSIGGNRVALGTTTPTSGATQSPAPPGQRTIPAPPTNSGAAPPLNPGQLPSLPGQGQSGQGQPGQAPDNFSPAPPVPGSTVQPNTAQPNTQPNSSPPATGATGSESLNPDE